MHHEELARKDREEEKIGHYSNRAFHDAIKRM